MLSDGMLHLACWRYVRTLGISCFSFQADHAPASRAPRFGESCGQKDSVKPKVATEKWQVALKPRTLQNPEPSSLVNAFLSTWARRCTSVSIVKSKEKERHMHSKTCIHYYNHNDSLYLKGTIKWTSHPRGSTRLWRTHPLNHWPSAWNCSHWSGLLTPVVLC